MTRLLQDSHEFDKTVFASDSMAAVCNLARLTPRAAHAPSDLVLGQADMAGGVANRGNDAPGAGTLFSPYGVHRAGVDVWAANTGNNRVLLWPLAAELTR
jgi:hypothetical protein